MNRFNPFARPTIKEQTPEEVTNNVSNKRTRNRKKTSDLVNLVNKNKASAKNLLPGSDFKIGYVPTNLSEKPECQGGKLDIEIDITETKFRDFAKKYQEFEKHYYDSSVDLLNFLESTILKQNKKGQFVIKKFSLDQLDDIEKNTRKRLLAYYSKCQELYTESFAELVKAVGIIVEGGSDNENVSNAAVEINNLRSD